MTIVKFMRITMSALLVLGMCFSQINAADPLDGFDEAVERAIKLHAVPGLGVAIVKDGKVILAKGYGVRTRGKSEPVTADTVFAIGSVSKSFTAALAAMAVNDDKLKWTTSVQEHIPNFKMPDVYRTQEIRLRDCLSHRVGLDRYDMVWYGSDFDQAAIFKRLTQMKTSFEFRTNFVYNNIMYAVAGETIAKAVGQSWAEQITKKIFEPLGMKSASTSTKKLAKDGDIASPHERIKGLPGAVPWLNLDCVGPAGSINASAADMAKYLQFQLTRGKAGDKRLLPSNVFAEMHKPQMLVPAGTGLGGLFNPEAKSSSYGFGWFLSDYHGKTLIEHGGNVDGMTAQVGFLPEEKLGVVFLANLGQSALPAALMFDTFDRFLNRPLTNNRVDGTSLLMWMVAAGVQVAGVKFDESKRDKDAKLPIKTESLVGSYEDDLYAPVTLSLNEKKLELKWTNFRYELEYWQFQTFRGKDPKHRWPDIGVSILLDENGKPTELKIKGLNIDSVRFSRK